MIMSHPEQAVPEALLQRIRQGDMNAFARFYETHSPLIYGMIRKIISDERTAEDVLRIVFLKIRNELVTSRGEIRSGISWMLQLARKIALDQKSDPAVKTEAHSPAAIFDLIYFHGLSVGAVAEKLGTTESEIRKAVQQAFRNFRNTTSSK